MKPEDWLIHFKDIQYLFATGARKVALPMVVRIPSRPNPGALKGRVESRKGESIYPGKGLKTVPTISPTETINRTLDRSLHELG